MKPLHCFFVCILNFRQKVSILCRNHKIRNDNENVFATILSLSGKQTRLSLSCYLSDDVGAYRFCPHHHPRLQHFSKSWPGISNCWHDWKPNLSLPPIPPSCLPYPMQGFTTSMLGHLRRRHGMSWKT